jgi:hypothetical protein
MIRYALPIGFAFLTIGCSNQYSGDGRLIDNGPQLKGGRYVVDLGPIDISKPGAYSYSLRGMPDGEFVVGFEIVEAKPNREQRPTHQAEVRLSLKDSTGRDIVGATGSLDSWVWSYGRDDPKSFLYRRVESEASDRGTYFTATSEVAYQLQLSILSSKMESRPVRLLIKSINP